MKQLLLWVLRWIIWAALGVVMPGRPAAKWLRHYLSGSGRSLALPDREVREFMERRLRELDKYLVQLGNIFEVEDSELASYRNVRNLRYENGAVKCDLHFDGSQAYEGAGFTSRPELFYLIGGFTAQVEVEIVVVRYAISDHYDWHQNESGWYFWSQTPFVVPERFHKLAESLVSVLGLEDYFRFLYGGTLEISNQLWADFAVAGARGFDSVYVGEFRPEVSEVPDWHFYDGRVEGCDEHQYDYSSEYEDWDEPSYPDEDGLNADEEVLEDSAELYCEGQDCPGFPHCRGCTVVTAIAV